MEFCWLAVGNVVFNHFAVFKLIKFYHKMFITS